MKQIGKRVVVTGGAGFIGSHLVDHLLLKGHFVRVVDNLSNGQLNRLKKWEHHSRLEFVKADICQFEEIKGAFSSVDWVFHLAALTGVARSMESPREYFRTNLKGTYNVLKASCQAGARRFLYAASASCYGAAKQSPTPETASISPQSPYALTKYLGELLVLKWAKAYRLSTLSLRLFNVFGPRLSKAGSYASVLGTFLTQKKGQQPLTIVGDGTQKRDFIYVDDVVEAFYRGALSNASGEAMNVGSGVAYSINLLAEFMGGPVTYIPKRSGEVFCSVADVEKIHAKLAWRAKVPFKEGLEQLLNEELFNNSAYLISGEKPVQNNLLAPYFFPAKESLVSKLHAPKRRAG